MFNHSSELKEKLHSALQNKGEKYQARTKYIDKNKQPIYTNRLILEDSPYLLQHAHNPVDWYPWGEEAFAEAKKQNKPVFLSIGYSTCHWCHVMEEESFDNKDIAEVMNNYFICIKVDRELHPDVDTYYMTAVMMMQGHGGWPMSSFLTPDRKPFFGGTYYQPAQFIALMERVYEVWQKQYDDIIEQANAISQQVTGAMASQQSLNEIGINIVDITAQTIMNHYDRHYGGFGNAPKFPNEPYLYFLLEYTIYSGSTDVLNAVFNTLHIQGCGGIYDQIGGGFHRYATDVNWLVPHFEKMLYNQGNLAFIFAQAYALTKEKDFKRIACETLDYVIREMTNADGGIYSATDADSEGEEGLFFIWEKTEVESLLGNDAEEFIKLYQVTKGGNFEGRNILHLEKPLIIYAEENNIDYDDLIERLEKSKQLLWDARAKRIPPLRDDKIITAWNAMMIKAYAYAGRLFNKRDYIDAAIKAADYVLTTNRTDDKTLSRSSLDGQASIPALQEDYAYLAEALIQLYDVTHDQKWLTEAMQLTDKMIDQFWDQEQGGFFMGIQDKNTLLPSSPKEINDNATSSGNSVALKILVRLAHRTDLHQYQTTAQQLIRTWSNDITQRPYICSYLICGLLEMLVGEQSAQQWSAEGNIFIDASSNKQEKDHVVTLDIKLNNDWHLNQQTDQNKNLVPVIIEPINNWQIQKVDYPEAVIKNLDFQSDAVNVYEGNIKISFHVINKQHNEIRFPDNLLKLRLTLQACNNEKCLTPENINLVILLF